MIALKSRITAKIEPRMATKWAIEHFGDVGCASVQRLSLGKDAEAVLGKFGEAVLIGGDTQG
jgi:hypothetical protein